MHFDKNYRPAPTKNEHRNNINPVIDRVMRGEVRYCPHGRPVSIELTKYQLDKNFKRV